ncbi:helix-turn-helix domain-containing protein [Sneathiella limimaris]|uniref:helix-turn-helix domain-containing protein n=1 Tax=Sneathiella limimaris TaxID=1964213 RepID=UPI00146A8A8F|nr:XRE family transcriptional regulator [Sneathiella limimaris]
MDKLNVNKLGRHIQKLRRDREISLSQLAQGAGIAKSNLSRIEQGNGNPTVDTIWRLAIQLKVPFSTLILPLSGSIEESEIEVRLIDHGTDNPPIDVYWMTCAPHSKREAEAHSPGTTETVTVISGQLEVGVLDEIKLLSAGETHTFNADQPHFYQTGENWATVLMTIIYAKEQGQK